jgi:hypothetical protein
MRYMQASRPLSPQMVASLKDIDAKHRGADHRTERALRARGLIVPSDDWPYVELTDSGREALQTNLAER